MGLSYRDVRRLIVNPGTEMVWEIPLRGGCVRLGRDDGNTAIADDPSISGTHCEFLVTADRVVVRDLGSANGVCVDGVLVAEAELQPGQVFQLGEVQLQYECSAAVGGAVSGRVMLANLSCKTHPRAFARYFCKRCDRGYCDLCVNARHVEGRAVTMCRACGSECVPVERPEEEVVVEKPLYRQLAGEFLYPVRGDGLFILVLGGVMFSLVQGALHVVAYAPLIGLTSLVALAFFGPGYMTAYMKEIITATANGEDQAPDWPDISSFGADVVVPFFQLVGTTLISFAPAIGMAVFVACQGESAANTEWYGWCLFCLILFGAFYFPMAFTALAMFDSIGALSPFLIIPSITRIMREYMLVVIFLAVILVTRYLAGLTLQDLAELASGKNVVLRICYGMVASVFMNFIGLYLIMVEMRMLGLLYRLKKWELRWFNH